MNYESKVNEIIEHLKKIIFEEMFVQIYPENLDPDTPLFEDGLAIDSVAIVELISLLEEKFDIQFSDEDLVPESFSNLNQLSCLIARKKQEKPNA